MVDRLPSLNALRAFETAARHLSLTRAADELHVTPAAVSHQIKALESDLGTQLFRRVGRDLYLTDAAQAALPALRAAFDNLATATRRLREANDGHIITVSAAPSFASSWLLPRLERFREVHPEFDVRLDASARLVDFARDSVDIAVRYGSGDWPGLDVTPLFDDVIFPVCNPALRDGRPPLRTPDDLARHRLLHYEWQTETGTHPDWKMWLMAAGATRVDPNRGPRFTALGMAVQAAVEGHGVALGSHAICQGHLAAGRLVKPFDFEMKLEFSYFVAVPPGNLGRRPVAAFRDWLLAEASGEPTEEAPRAAAGAPAG
jgi:LysR family glycine cleavage system transcriptional activator